MVFKRILLLVPLLIVVIGLLALVVPSVSALTWSSDASSLAGWTIQNTGIQCDGSAFYRDSGSGRGVMFYELDGDYLTGDFDYVVHVQSAGTSQPTEVYIRVRDGAGKALSFEYTYSSSRKSVRVTGPSGFEHLTSLSLPFDDVISLQKRGDSITYTARGVSKTFTGIHMAAGPDPQSVELNFYRYPIAGKSPRVTYMSLTTPYEPPVCDPGEEPVRIRLVDHVTDALIDDIGTWHLNILDGRSSASPDDRTLVDADYSENEITVCLPRTSILSAHWIGVDVPGYEQVPARLLFDVPAGGRTLVIRLTPLDPVAPPGERVLTFEVIDADDGVPMSDALVNIGSSSKYTGAYGSAWFTVPENSTHKWVVTSSTGRYWATGGETFVGSDDVTVVVSLVARASDLPRPPIPEIPNFPVVHPIIDPGVLRSHILDVPLLGTVAAPFLDFIDDLIHGVDEVVDPVLDFVAGPLRDISSSMGSVGEQIQESVTGYAATSAVLLGSVGTLLSAFPDLVLGLVSYGLLLDLVYLLLRGGM